MKRLRAIIAGFAFFGSIAIVSAAPHEARLPLHDGELRLADLSRKLLEELHLPATHLPPGEINLNGLSGSLFIAAMNRSLGDGCRLETRGNELVLHVDPDKLPNNITSAEHAMRVFTATAAPRATVAQARHYGLLLPAKIDSARPLVILIHGLDMDNSAWASMATLLAASGYQVGYFGYPGDGPLADDTALLTQHMAALRDTFPKLKVDVITFSMGALVARAYIEGGSYRGGIDHLIMLAPPNHGSNWAYLQFLAGWKEQAELAVHDPQWSPTWMITDGLGEAGYELLPDSRFLAKLNALPRRVGVRYTIIAGDERPVRRLAADGLKASANLIPAGACWGFRQCRSELSRLSTEIGAVRDSCDGPVTLSSAALSGVSDVVHLHADHETIYQSDDAEPPAAWEAIQQRLNQKP